jgi:hypothetical protein
MKYKRTDLVLVQRVLDRSYHTRMAVFFLSLLSFYIAVLFSFLYSSLFGRHFSLPIVVVVVVVVVVL